MINARQFKFKKRKWEKNTCRSSASSASSKSSGVTTLSNIWTKWRSKGRIHRSTHKERRVRICGRKRQESSRTFATSRAIPSEPTLVRVLERVNLFVSRTTAKRSRRAAVWVAAKKKKQVWNSLPCHSTFSYSLIMRLHESQAFVSTSYKPQAT